MPEDTALSLVGFMPEAEAHDYLRKVCRLEPHQRQAEVLTATWQNAREKLGEPIAGAGKPAIHPIPPEYNAYLRQVVAHPRFMNPIDGMGVDIAVVEIEPLLAYQQHIWIEYCQDLCKDIPRDPPFHIVLGICLPDQIAPIAPDIEVVRGPNAGQIAIVVKDFNIETKLLTTYPGSDQSVHVIGWQQQRSLPYVQVAVFDGKCYVRNGFHRIVGLHARGVREVPCIFLRASTPGELGIRAGRTFGQDLLESANPPTVAHFTQGRAVRLPLQRFERVLTVQDEVRPSR